MMNLLSILLWLPALAVKLALAAIGLVVVPFTHPYKNPLYGNREHPRPPSWFMPEYERGPLGGFDMRLRDYVWRAIRNPVNNLRYFFEEPSWQFAYCYGDINPDHAVRSLEFDAAWRFMRDGLYSEFWYLRYSERFDRYFEFRIGWKFSGVPGFAPTIQLRFGRT